MPTQRASYCTLADVTTRLYSGQGTTQGATGDPGRDALLTTLMAQVSRRFDQETGRNAGAYAPLYDSRMFSGRGAQVLDTDAFATLAKLEYNTTPGRTPSWVDVTPDVGTSLIGFEPVRYWPKTSVWRMATFVVDPYRTGNVRLTGIYGEVQPDLGATPPTAPGGVINDPLWPSFAGVSLASVQPVNPVTLQPQGWWITPEDVVKAVAEWTVYTFKAGQAGYGDTAGNPSGGPLIYRKGIPPEVSMVIDSYNRRSFKLAMIGIDGVDIANENVYGPAGSTDLPSRWAGWITR